MSKNFVHHMKSVSLPDGALYNNPSFPSGTPDGRIRDDIYRALAANREVDDEDRWVYRELLQQTFPELYEELAQREDSRAAFLYQGTSLGMRAGGGELTLIVNTPHHFLHRVDIKDELVSVVPTASIDRQGAYEPINRHEAWALAAGITAVSLASLRLNSAA